ncbi:DUF998 domain-containing protein [uncultured Sulfitobacter sp.]|uniref:DUF998 domain-containing protein n=1 Tax=uncultured Sulfitobacter sp. TaxID=191468 RepID=UPI002603169E|nr:DUF998 domain-containing protein [uncultured Sulfitobacter sp.]
MTNFPKSDRFGCDEVTWGGHRSELLLVCALSGIVGSVAPIVLNVIAAGVAEHDFVADTISDLGRGPHKWIMDYGFYINAFGLLALAIGSAHAHLGRLGWSLGIFVLAGTAFVTVLIGVWDKFGGPTDMSVHTKLTFFLGPLYLFGPLLMLGGAGPLGRGYTWLFITAAVLWAFLATAFKLAPNGIDGALEKAAVIATQLWTIPLAWLLWTVGREAT